MFFKQERPEMDDFEEEKKLCCKRNILREILIFLKHIGKNFQNTIKKMSPNIFAHSFAI